MNSLIYPCRLEYPGVGPEVSFLKDTGRAEFHSATDAEAIDGKLFYKSRVNPRTKILNALLENGT